MESGSASNLSLFLLARLYESTDHTGVGFCVAQMLKFLVKVFISLYLLNMLMDQLDTLQAIRYWAEVLCSNIMISLGDLEVKVMDLDIFC